jgi:hypothetical protein
MHAQKAPLFFESAFHAHRAFRYVTLDISNDADYCNVHGSGLLFLDAVWSEREIRVP